MSASSVRVLARLVLTALIFAGISSRPASADTLFYGTPDEAVRAQMMIDLGSVIENLQAAALSKQDINAQFADARARAAASCAGKVHDETAEATLTSLLDQKDIYFLIFALQSSDRGVSNEMRALEDFTGGQLDNGIPLSAQFMFDRWANSVSADLEGQPVWNPAALVSAISRNQLAYIQYVSFRNKAEIDDFLKGLGQPGSLLDPSPDALADAYLSNVLKPAIAKSGNSAEEKSTENQWAEEIRAAIVAYENGPLDPNAIAEHLRQHNAADLVRQFVSNASAPNADVLRAYEDLWEAESAREGNPGIPPPSRDKLLLSLKAWSSEGLVTRLGSLMSNDALAKVGLNPRDEYLSKREVLRIMAGPSHDWCTGAALTKLKEASPHEQAAKSLEGDANDKQRIEADVAGIGKEAAKVGAATADKKEPSATAAPQPQNQPPAAAKPPVSANFEVSGLRIGMSIADADRIIRNQMKVAAVVEQVHPFNKASIFDRRLYASEGGSQRIVIYWHASIPNQIVGASVYAELPDFTSSGDVDTILNRQFGPPTKIEGRSRVWTADPEALERNRCTLQGLSQGAGFEYTEGSIPRSDSATTADDVMGAASETLAVFTFQDPARWQEAASCPTTRVADVTEGFGGRKAYLLIGLVDGKYVMDHLKSVAAGESEKSLATLDTFLKPQPGASPESPAKANVASPPAAAPSASTIPDDAAPPFASPALATKQRDLVAVWPGFAELRLLKPQEYDAALATVPAPSGVTDVNNGISIISAAMDLVIKSNLDKLTRVDDDSVVDILKSQIAVYQAMESNLGEEFCGRAVQNDLGKFREPSFVLAHFQQYLAIVKGKLDLQRKIISAQESFKTNPSRGAPADADLAGFAPQIGLLQTYRGTRQYDKICGALTDFLTKVVEGTDAQAGKARLTTLVSIQ